MKYTIEATKIFNFLNRFLAKHKQYLSSSRKPRMDRYNTVELQLVIKCIVFLGKENELNNLRFNILNELCSRKFGKEMIIN